MPQTPLRSLQALEPINEADFAPRGGLRERMNALSRWAMADHFGTPTPVTHPPVTHPMAEPVDLRELASAVKQVSAVVGADSHDAVAQLATQVRQASEQLSTRGDVTAEQKSDIEQVWQAIVEMERLANADARAK